MEICEFYVDDNNVPKSNLLYSKTLDGRVTLRNPTKRLIDYLAIGNIYFENEDIFGLGDAEEKIDTTGVRDAKDDNLANIKADVAGKDMFGHTISVAQPSSEQRVEVPVMQQLAVQQSVISPPVSNVNTTVQTFEPTVTPVQSVAAPRPVISPVNTQRISITPTNIVSRVDVGNVQG